MKRREFIAGLGSAAAWPKVVRAQQPQRKRVGVLLAYEKDDPQAKALLSLFTDALAQLGWSKGRNLEIDIRLESDDVGRMEALANELVGLRPDLVFAYTTPATAALQKATRTIPIVFVFVSDPVGAGFVASLPHPGGNITGFINVEAGLGGKWVQLLIEIAPSVKRVAIVYNPETAPTREVDVLALIRGGGPIAEGGADYRARP